MQQPFFIDKLLQCLEDYQETYRAILNSSKLGEKEKSSVINRQVIALQRIMDYVYLYGSESACKIASSWQQYGFAHAQDKKQTIIPVCYANILIAQICLDVTGNCNRPSYYYKIKLSDYINLTATERKKNCTPILQPKLITSTKKAWTNLSYTKSLPNTKGTPYDEMLEKCESNIKRITGDINKINNYNETIKKRNIVIYSRVYPIFLPKSACEILLTCIFPTASAIHSFKKVPPFKLFIKNSLQMKTFMLL